MIKRKAKIYLLLLMATLFALPGEIFAFRYDVFEYNILDEDAKTCEVTKYLAEEWGGDIIIPATASYNGNDYQVIAIGDSAFYDLTVLSSVAFPESLITIGKEAFRGCYNLTSATFPESLTTISEHAFENCYGLTGVVFPERLYGMADGVFSGCTGLTSVEYKAYRPIDASSDCFETEVYDSATLTMPNATLADIAAVTPWNLFKNVVAKDGTLPAEEPQVGDEFEYNGLWYRVTDVDNNSCEVIANPSREEYSGEVAIPEVAMIGDNEYTVTGIGNNAFMECTELTGVTFPETLTTIGMHGFLGCSNLSSVDLPESLTKLGYYSFNHCISLESVVLPDSLTEIGGYAFEGCTNLVSVDFPATLTIIYEAAFNGCTKLAEVDFPGTLTRIASHAFNDCIGLTSIVFPNLLAAIEMDSFQGCTNLESIELPASLTELGREVFGGCMNLSSVKYLAEKPIETGEDRFFSEVYESAMLTMPNATIADIKAVTPWNLFRNVVAKDGTLPAEDPQVGDEFEYEGIRYTILDTEAMTCETRAGGEDDSGNEVSGDIIIPEKVSLNDKEYTVIGIGRRSFIGCTGMTSLRLPGSLTEIGLGAFANTGLQSVDFSACTALNMIGDFAFQDTQLQSVDLTHCVALDRINQHAFSKCANLRSIGLPERMKSIAGYAFWHCTSLNEITLPESIEELLEAAFWESGLESIDLSGNNNLKIIGEFTFADCLSLKSIKLPSTLETIGYKGFASPVIESVEYSASEPVSASDGCFDEVVYESATLTMPNATLAVIADVTPWNLFKNVVAQDGTLPAEEPHAGDKFEYDGVWYRILDVDERVCEVIASSSEKYSGEIIIPDSVRYVGISFDVTDIGFEAFRDCEGLSSIVLPSSLTTIANNAFSHCTNLRSIELPSSLAIIGSYVFDACESLTDIKLPSSLIAIGDGAFYGCESLTDIELPSSLPMIGMFTFSGCKDLSSIMLPSSLTRIETAAFWDCTSLTDIVLPSFLTRIGERAFNGCTGLTSIELPSLLTTIENGAFTGCIGLTNIRYLAENPIEANSDCFDTEIYESATLTMSNATLAVIADVTPWNLFKNVVAKDGKLPADEPHVGDRFEYRGVWYAITKLFQPECEVIANPDSLYTGDVTIVDLAMNGEQSYRVTRIADEAFLECRALTSVRLPLTLEYIGNSSFGVCTSLTEINLPSGLVRIEENAFAECTGLTSLKIPDAVAYIGSASFGGCTGLKSIEIPASILMMEGAFGGCPNIESVYYPAEKPVESSESDFDEQVYEVATLTMPNATLEDIQSTMPWIFFRNVVAKDGVLPPVEPETVTFSHADPSDGSNVSAFYEIRTYWNTDGRTLYGNESEDYFARLTHETGETLARSPLMRAGEDESLFVMDFSGDYAPGQYMVYIPEGALVDDNGVGVSEAVTLHYTLEPPVFVPSVGDEFEYEGLWYTVTDNVMMTCETRGGSEETPGNDVEGDVVVTDTVYYASFELTVTGVGDYGFSGSSDMLSITLPATVESVGTEAFADCDRLTSLVWRAHRPLDRKVISTIDNPNLLVYVDSVQFAPSGLTRNVVVMESASGDPECESLVLEPARAFRAALPFTALHSTMTKEFTQKTPIDGCAGWETIVLPFDATSVRVADARGELTPFRLVTDILHQYPYWLYKADSAGDWMEADSIKAGVPYIISMPNNEEYEARYNIDGPVTFSNDTRVRITPETTAPYAVTWPTGREFRSLWLPLAADEVAGAMGLNVGMSDLTDDNGQTLDPGSAFCAGVEPQPLEAYVTRRGAERAMRITRSQSGVLMTQADDTLRVESENCGVTIYSGSDRHVDIFSADGVRVAACEVKAGEAYRVDDLEKGIYIVAGRKVVIKN